MLWKLILAMILIPVFFMGSTVWIWVGEIACCYIMWQWVLEPQINAFKKAAKSDDEDIEDAKSSN